MIYVCASIYNVQATNHFGSSQPSWLKSVSGQTGLGEKISKRSPKRTGKETPAENVQVSSSCSEPSPCDVSFSKGRRIIRFRFVKWSRISNIFRGAHDPLSKEPLRRPLISSLASRLSSPFSGSSLGNTCFVFIVRNPVSKISTSLPHGAHQKKLYRRRSKLATTRFDNIMYISISETISSYTNSPAHLSQLCSLFTDSHRHGEQL